MCVTLLRKSKREYYQNLSVGSNKIMPSEKITLVEATNILKNDKETAKDLHNLFSTIIKNLKIPQYKE